jgi:putative thioredoxin
VTDLPPASLRGAVDRTGRRPPGAAAPARGGTGEVVVPALVIEGSDANFGQVLELSRTVAVIVELYAGSPSAVLERVILGYSGRFLLARVDAQRNPQLVQAFQAVAAPTVAAVIGGRPIALYEGELPESEARSVFDQVVTLAGQNGVTGIAKTADAEPEGEPIEPVEQPLPPHHQEAFDAIDRGDYAAAIAEYRTAIAQDPRDELAIAGLAQVSLLHRLEGTSAAELRTAAAANPGDLDAQLAVADLDVSGGHLEDAFGRLLDLFPGLDQAGKDAVRTRLLSYFEIAGADDPRVASARRRLTGLLY